MSIKQTLNQFYTELKDNLTTTKAIDNFRYGFTNITTLPGVSLMMVFDKAEVQTVTPGASVSILDCVLFVQNLKSLTQQDDLVTYFEEIFNYIDTNPTLGGAIDSRVTSWDISVSDDGINTGLLAIEFQIVARI